MAQLIQVVVYINGYRFDPRSVSASFTAGDTCHFSVDVPPVPEWDLLLPRSHGAVFFLDPVTSTYRLLCEGDYVGLSRAKAGTGQRSRTLHFQGLHSKVFKTKHFNMVGAAQPPGSALGQVGASARANGNVVAYPSSLGFTPVSVSDTVSKLATSPSVSAVFPELMKRMMAQTPVESYYYWARRIHRKQWTLLDLEAHKTVDFGRFEDLVKNGFNSFSLGYETTLGEIYQAYEGLCFYQHFPIPAPALYRAKDKDDTTVTIETASEHYIPELFYAPMLYNTVPPACNIVFADQITNVGATLGFDSVPTRIISRYDGPANSSMPFLYMANNTQGALSVTDKNTPTMTPGNLCGNGNISQEELIRGIHSVTRSIAHNKVIPGVGDGASQTNRPSFASTLSHLVLQEFSRARGETRTADFQLVFQPYLVPGMACVIEDGSSPLRAMITTVTHSLPCNGEPSTSIHVDNVDELYQVGNVSRTPPIPSYMCKFYRPNLIASTYKNILGLNFEDTPHAAAVPDKLLASAIASPAFETTETTIEGYVDNGQVNLDRLLGGVVQVPNYSETGERLGWVSNVADCVAERLRASSDPQAAFLRYQYRSGCSLQDWMIMHGLQPDVSAAKNAGVNTNPPLNIGNRATGGSTNGDDVFGYPSALALADGEDGDPSKLRAWDFKFPVYGVYKAIPDPASISLSPAPAISRNRQTLTASIQAAILKGATLDVKLT